MYGKIIHESYKGIIRYVYIYIHTYFDNNMETWTYITYCHFCNVIVFFVPLPQYEWEFLLFNLSSFQHHFNPRVEHLYTLQFFPPPIQPKENNPWCLSRRPLADSSTDRASWHCSTSTRVERPGATRWIAIFAALKACTIHRNDVDNKMFMYGIGDPFRMWCGDVVMCVCVCFFCFICFWSTKSAEHARLVPGICAVSWPYHSKHHHWRCDPEEIRGDRWDKDDFLDPCDSLYTYTWIVGICFCFIVLYVLYSHMWVF